jgi:hypothetical protein
MLFSRIVRSRESCQRCGAPATDCAHIVPRRYSATRCLEDNAWALCRSCHRLTGEWPEQFIQLVIDTIGGPHYTELRKLAEAGIGTSSALFWASEVERLEQRCIELGIDTRVRVPREG